VYFGIRKIGRQGSGGQHGHQNQVPGLTLGKFSLGHYWSQAKRDFGTNGPLRTLICLNSFQGLCPLRGNSETNSGTKNSGEKRGRILDTFSRTKLCTIGRAQKPWDSREWQHFPPGSHKGFNCEPLIGHH